MYLEQYKVSVGGMNLPDGRHVRQRHLDLRTFLQALRDLGEGEGEGEGEEEGEGEGEEEGDDY